MPDKLKLYGERHTNTNYLSRLIELNVDCEMLSGTVPRYVRTMENLLGRQWLRDAYFRATWSSNLGWKHSVVKTVPADSTLNFITLTKNPYSWLLSLHRRPYHQTYSEAPAMEEFLASSWRTVGRENASTALANPIELWNLKNRSYLGLPDHRSLHLTSESTLIDPAAVIEKIAAKFSYEVAGPFQDYEQSTKKHADRDGDYYRDYYLNERWRDELSSEAIDMINTALDRELMDYFGYDLL